MPYRGRQVACWIAQPTELSIAETAGLSSDSTAMPQQRLVAERRWRLGVQSRGHPSAIVAELLRALRASQVRVTVRWCCCLGTVC